MRPGGNRPLGIRRVEGEDPEGVMARDQRRAPHPRRLDVRHAEPGPGGHGLPDRLEPERAEQRAEVLDLAGLCEQLPQHRGPLGRDGAKMPVEISKLGTAVLQGGANGCEMRDARWGCVASHLTSRLSHLGLYVPFLSRIAPFTRRGPMRPEIKSGKSEVMSPFTVCASTSVERVGGRVTVIPPFTVRNSRSPDQSARPSAATIEPFTVVAAARPMVERLMRPFTVVASTFAPTPSASTWPLTVRAESSTPAGTRTVKSTTTSLWSVLDWPPPPGVQSFASWACRGVG